MTCDDTPQCLSVCVCLTLCLHTGADQGQRVAGKLTAGAGDGSTGQQNQDAWVGAVGAVLLQVAVLKGLWKDRKKDQQVAPLQSFRSDFTLVSNVT